MQLAEYKELILNNPYLTDGSESDIGNPKIIRYEGVGVCPICKCRDVYMCKDKSLCCCRCGLVYKITSLSQDKFDYTCLMDQSEKL